MIHIQDLITRLKTYDREKRCGCKQCQDSMASAGAMELMFDELTTWRAFGHWARMVDDGVADSDAYDQALTMAQRLERITDKHLDLITRKSP